MHEVQNYLEFVFCFLDFDVKLFPALRCNLPAGRQGWPALLLFFYAIPRASVGRGVLSRKNSRSVGQAFHCDLG